MTVRFDRHAIMEALKPQIMDGIEEAANLVLKTANDMILDPNKHGAVYTTLFKTLGTGSGRVVVPYGSRPPHQASAPGEAPANDTGELVRRSEVEVFPNEFRAVARWTSPQAAYMQFGTDRVEPRPFATLALAAAAPRIPEVLAARINLIAR